MNIDLSGKTAIVTGATSALGRVIATTFARCGARVVLHYFTNRQLAEKIGEDIKHFGGSACIVQADVTSLESIQAIHRAIADEDWPVDIIVNNAVTQFQWTSVIDQPVHDYEDQFRSCVMHNLYMIKTFVPQMIRRGWGRVIGINTECSFQCWPTQSAYVSGKHGMNALLQTLAKEVGPNGITVNQIAPGWIRSERDRDKTPESASLQSVSDEYSRMLPLKHRGEELDVANAAAFLASDLARFITGVILPVNGGGACIPKWLHAQEL
jgi:3-oxoacyl-[acyl-carrier protein] reductase